MSKKNNIVASVHLHFVPGMKVYIPADSYQVQRKVVHVLICENLTLYGVEPILNSDPHSDGYYNYFHLSVEKTIYEKQ